MTDRSDDSGYYSQEFNFENRLIEVTDNGSGDVTTFYYDANGQRTITVFDDGSTTETTHYPFPDLTVEDPGGGNQVERVTYFFNGQAVAVRVDDGSPVLSWLHTDHLGSTSVATNSSGYEITGSRAKYMPFGEERQVSTADLNDRGFTGHIEDDYIKLVYMNARWYAPGLGRFLSADTIVPEPGNSQAWNRFAYVNNNPVNFLDPTGHCAGSYNTDTGNATADQDCWNFLYNEFCNGGVVGICSDWQELLIHYQSCNHPAAGCRITFGTNWTKDELLTLRDAHANIVKALDDHGYDSAKLLDGIRYQRKRGPGGSWVNPYTNTIRLKEVSYDTVYHEIGHAVSFNTGRDAQDLFFSYVTAQVNSGQHDFLDYCRRMYCQDSPWAVFAGENTELWADAFNIWVASTVDMNNDGNPDRPNYGYDYWNQGYRTDWGAVEVGVISILNQIGR